MTIPIETLFDLPSGTGRSRTDESRDLKVGTAVHGTIDPSG